MSLFFWVAVVGGVGSLLRYWLFSLEPSDPTPLSAWLPPSGTHMLLTVNLLGGLLAGWVTNLPRRRLSTRARAIMLFGFCGGLTTFSTFSHQALLAYLADPLQGVLFALGSTLLVLFAVVLGYIIAGWWYQ